MKGDYKQVDEHRKWGKRETWIGGTNSPHMPVVSKGELPEGSHSHTHRPPPLTSMASTDEGCAPGHYNNNVDAIKKQAPKVSFPKSSRFLSQKSTSSLVCSLACSLACSLSRSLHTNNALAISQHDGPRPPARAHRGRGSWPQVQRRRAARPRRSASLLVRSAALASRPQQRQQPPAERRHAAARPPRVLALGHEPQRRARHAVVAASRTAQASCDGSA